MINNSLKLLKSDHATLNNFKPIFSHFLKNYIQYSDITVSLGLGTFELY